MKYERIRYPDGQISAKLTDLDPPYQVIERINSYEDLIFIKAIADAMSYSQRPLNHSSVRSTNLGTRTRWFITNSL